jgi:uncharacterized RDD family membrane protein YckC
MSFAQRDTQRIDDAAEATEALEPFALKQQIAEKVAAHRARRGAPAGPQLAQAAPGSSGRARSARIAAAVAERYAHSQSYRAFLAEEAEKAIRQAEAAAEVAQRNAEAVAAAQYELLAELDQYADEPPALVLTPVEPPPYAAPAPASPPPEAISVPAAELRVRLYEDVPLVASRPNAVHTSHATETLDEAETIALDEEIAFRQDPIFEPSIPPVEIPANLIEFPRQLVAARRARPRLAEGPLREEDEHSPGSSQLRIFEVEAAQISSAPAIESAAPEWSSILLSPQPAPTMVQELPEAPFIPPMVPQTASINLRLMAAIVDAVIVTAALLVFIAVFALTAAHFGRPDALRMTPRSAIIAAVSMLALFGLAYQLLFFTFSEATLGMRYARIGLCTFSDDNPTRSAMRHRIFAHLLSACPLGIGYLWALLDDDRLGWHDRITRMYQRSY